MATYTSNYGWTKPSGSDNVDISVLNNNLDDQDSTIHDAFLNMAPPFSESSTYAVDDIVLYGTGLYKCHTAVVTPGSWTGSTNWQVYKLSEGGSGGGGGTTNYNALTNKPQINSVELSGNKTASQLGLMASDGVVANPTGQTTGTLSALEVGGAKYAVGGGSGTSDYTDLTNKPSINGVTLSGNKTTSDLGINIPTDLADLDDDATHRLVTDTEKATWNGKSDFSGSYADLSNKPENANTFQGTIAEWNQLTTAEKKAYDHASIPDSLDGNVTFPASKVMMNDGESVEERISAKSIISGDIATLSYETNYTAPSDGYLVGVASAGNGNYVTLNIGGINMARAYSGGANLGGYACAFVKKGMVVYFSGLSSSSTSARFIPLS